MYVCLNIEVMNFCDVRIEKVVYCFSINGFLSLEWNELFDYLVLVLLGIKGLIENGCVYFVGFCYWLFLRILVLFIYLIIFYVLNVCKIDLYF